MSTTILSILLGIGGMFGWGLYDFLGGVFAKQIGPFRSLFWSQLAGLISLVVLAVLLKTSPAGSTQVLLLSALAAMLYSAGYLFFFKGFEIGNVSIVAATMNLWAVFTMLFAFLLMGQRLTVLQTLGVSMIILGAAAASIRWSEIRQQKFQLSAGVKEAALGAFFFGIFWNVSEVISEKIGWLFTSLYVKLGIIIFLLIYALLARQAIRLRQSTATTKLMIALMGVIEAGAVAMVNFGLTIGDAILITPIASALSIVTIALALVFLKDRLSKVQLFGMLTAVAGIIVTAF
jgi:transporter family protein